MSKKGEKRIFYTELAYVMGIVTLALGTALMERADFGVSMVVAPAYLLHLKISEALPFFSFGMAGYTLQAAMILVMMAILRRAKLSYFLSIVTAVIYGLVLDGMMALVALIPNLGFWQNVVFFIIGTPVCSIGVSLLLRPYFPPEAYDLFVKEISKKFDLNMYRVKTVYDCASLVISVVLSFAFYGMWHFEGIKMGTIICAILNGTLIGTFTKVFNRSFKFEDRFDLRKHF